MKNPLIPFGATIVLGIVLMFIISFYGASQLGEAKGGGKSQASTQSQANSANATPKAIFEGHCAQCHGENLQGKIGPNLQHIGSQMSKDDILNQIKNGGGGMPPGVIQGEQAKKVATWLAKKK
ncbi:MAG TPA: cytochrome c [Bacillales bacterium]|nr:cytochrome c [Bacillales bacterium]